MWVQLQTVMSIEQHGVTVHYKPGDWVDVGRQAALRWISEGRAISPRPIHELIPSGSGIVTVGLPEPSINQLDSLGLDVQRKRHAELLYPRTLLLRGGAEFRTMLFPVGFNLLSTWQLAVPLLAYDTLAAQLSTDEDRDLTRAVIRDLRVPVYDTRLLFVRKCADTIKLINLWDTEMQRGPDERLAFMRALYQVKPTICALPVSWTQSTLTA